jgi:hypothetical protein
MLKRFRYVLRELADVFRGMTSARRRARFGDLDFDWDHRVDTTMSNVRLGTRLKGVIAGSQYQAADPGLFAESMAAIPIDFSRYIFIDAGSGKGRALLMASEYPFRKVLGIEVVPELHAAAESNIALFPRERRKAGIVEALLADALSFEWPSEPTVLFLFNPFPEWVLRQFLERLRISLMESPRKVWVVYHNPVLRALLLETAFLDEVSYSLQAALFTNDAPEPQ